MGLEPTRVLPHRILSPADGCRKSNQVENFEDGTCSACGACSDVTLRRVIEAWPDLPGYVKEAVMTLIEGSNRRGPR